MSGFSPEVLAKAQTTLQSVREEWLQRPGVTAVDLGYKWTHGQMTGQLSIRVHVTKKINPAELDESEIFPREIGGIPVDVIEANYAPQALVDVRPEFAVEGRGKRYDIIPLGVSVGSRYATAGTLGAKVYDVKTGVEMILSNWHVFAGRLQAQEGLSIWQPGWIDGNMREENTIAHLTRWILGPFDAAVATLTGSRVVQSQTLEGKLIEDVTQPQLGMMVWKSGRSTGYTEGFIDGIMMTVPLSYGAAGIHVLEEVIRIVPRPGTGNAEVSKGGDSGSVWVDEKSGKAVGLHFAGEVSGLPEHALANNINNVIDRLGVVFQAQKTTAKPDLIKEPDEAKKPSQGNFLAFISRYLKRYTERK